MIEALTWIVIKEKLSKLWEIVKKYWQFFLGMLVATFFFLLTRDSTKARKTLEKLRESNNEERDRSLQIQVEKDEEVNSAVDKFYEDIEEAAKSLKGRDEKVETEKEKIKQDLLSQEEKDPGSIADEISETLKKI